MTTGHRLAERFAETLTAQDLDAFSTLLHPDLAPTSFRRSCCAPPWPRSPTEN